MNKKLGARNFILSVLADEFDGIKWEFPAVKNPALSTTINTDIEILVKEIKKMSNELAEEWFKNYPSTFKNCEVKDGQA